MKLLTLFLVLMMAQPAAAQGGNGVAFFTTLQDVPLMQGLSEVEGDSLQFDKPEGRVTEATAHIDAATSQGVLEYYNASLPQFGWVRIAPNVFVRQNEKLSLNIESHEGHDFLKVRIIPH